MKALALGSDAIVFVSSYWQTTCTAVRAGDAMDAAAMTDLLRALELAEDPFSCFHGRPTMIRLRGRDLERWFYRRD